MGPEGRRFEPCNTDQHKSETGRCRSFSRGNRTQKLGVAGTRNRTPLEHWPRGPRQRLAKPWPRKRLVRSNRTCSASFFTTYSDPLTQRPECLPVQEEAKGSTPLRIATHPPRTSVRLAPHPPISPSHFPPALAQLDQSTGLRSRGLHVRIVCAGPNISHAVLFFFSSVAQLVDAPHC